MMERLQELAPWIGVAAVVGVLAVLAPLLLDPPPPIYESPIRAAVEELSIWTFQSLFVAGLLLGWLAPVRNRELPLLAVAMVIFFPIRAWWDYRSGSPNVFWPQELILYVVWVIPAAFGMAVARTIAYFRRRFGNRKP